MSGINRFLSHREKNPRDKDKRNRQEKVISPLVTPHSSSNSSLHTFSGVPTLTSPYQRCSLNSSSSSLSVAFQKLSPKGYPCLQSTAGTVQASTANTYDFYLLQPRQTAGHLHGLFSEHEELVPEKDQEKKVRVFLIRRRY